MNDLLGGVKQPAGCVKPNKYRGVAIFLGLGEALGNNLDRQRMDNVININLQYTSRIGLNAPSAHQQ